MPYNLSTIMTRAWEIYRTRFSLTPNRAAFRMSLKSAWSEAKRAVAQQEESPEVRKLRKDIAALDGKNFWSADDYAKRRELSALSVNLTTISRNAVNGTVHEYAVH